MGSGGGFVTQQHSCLAGSLRRCPTICSFTQGRAPTFTHKPQQEWILYQPRQKSAVSAKASSSSNGSDLWQEVDESALLNERRLSSLGASTSASSSDCEPSTQGKSGKPAEAYRQLLEELQNAAVQGTREALNGSSDLTEPFVAHEIARTLPPGDALFLGNSMPIRDMDAFGGCVDAENRSDAELPRMVDVDQGLGARVSANRGASGIDGVISTAAGYAFGLRKAVTLVIGDISFLHDVNGLNLLRTGEMSPPVTVVLVNNGGGGIFNFLPIASEVPSQTFTQLWSTPQNVDFAGLCRAHGLPYQKVTHAGELAPALKTARGLNKHSVVEVVTSKDTNVEEHRTIQASIRNAVLHALHNRALGTVTRAKFGTFELQLKAPVTTASTELLRHGIVLEVEMQAASRDRLFLGRGEVAPLPGLHVEGFEEAEAQVATLCELLQDRKIPINLFSDTGSMKAWLQHTVGIPASELYPSVVCGLEQALLAAVASAQNLPLHDALMPLIAGNAPTRLTNTSSSNPPQDEHMREGDVADDRSAEISVCGLLDCQGSPAEARAEAVTLLQKTPYRALKLKVARREDPLEDARVVLSIREAVGNDVVLRADANRKWNLEHATQFSNAVRAAKLQYVEEPLHDASQLSELQRLTACPIALDETLDQTLAQADGLQHLETLLGSLSVQAVVVKPSVVGGMLRTIDIAKVAAKFGIQVIVSSAFESDLGLSHHASLARAVNSIQPHKGVAFHGFGTARWFQQNMFEGSKSLLTGHDIDTDALSAYKDLPLNMHLPSQPNAPVAMQRTVSTPAGSFHFSYQSYRYSGTLDAQSAPCVVFLHGFLGCAEDWTPIAAGLSKFARCVAINLSGSADSYVTHSMESDSVKGSPYSIDNMAEAIQMLLRSMGLPSQTLIVAYSMGARLALELLARPDCPFQKALLISATAGIANPEARVKRAETDKILAADLERLGVRSFLERWYSAPMWGNLRQHVRFDGMLKSRQQVDERAMACMLAAASPGRSRSLWNALPSIEAEITLLAGSLDTKYVELGHKLADGSNFKVAKFEIVVGAGHAVHVEASLRVLKHAIELLKQ